MSDSLHYKSPLLELLEIGLKESGSESRKHVMKMMPKSEVKNAQYSTQDYSCDLAWTSPG